MSEARPVRTQEMSHDYQTHRVANVQGVADSSGLVTAHDLLQFDSLRNRLTKATGPTPQKIAQAKHPSALAWIQHMHTSPQTLIRTSSARRIGRPIMDGKMEVGKLWPAYPTCDHSHQTQ